MPEFSAAMRTVENAVARAEAGASRVATGESRRRIGLAEQEARAKVRATQKAEGELRRSQTQGLREAERAERDKVRLAEQGARDRVRAMQRADATVRRITEQAVRDAARAEAAKNADAERWVRERERQQRRQAAAEQRFAGRVVGAAGSGFRSGMSRVAAATQQVAGTVLGLGGGMSVADSVQRSISATGLAADIANSGYMPNSADAAARTKRSTGEIMGAARGVAVRTGTSVEDNLKGLQAFVGKSGDLDTGLKVMGQLSELSVATGASFSDVADAAGDLMSQLGDMPNKSEAVMTIMRGIAGQGKLGAVEMRNMASQMAKLAAAAGQFGGNAVDNILKMGMLAQEARASGGASSATMAATSVVGFTNTLKTPARIAQFKAAGIDVFDKDKNLNDPTKIIMQSLQKTGGDPEQLKKLFANIMGERAIGGYASAYRHAEGKEKGSGTAAVQAMMDRQLKGSSMSKEDVAKAFSERMAEDDKRIAQVREKFDRAVSEQLIPKFLELVPVIEQMIPVFIDLQAKALPAFVGLIKTIADFAERNKEEVAWMAAHPIGALIAAEITKSVGGTLVSEALKGVIAKAGSAGLVVGTAAVAITTGVIAIDELFNNLNKERGSDVMNAGNVHGEALALERKVREGTATPEDIGRLTKVRDELAGKVGAQEANVNNKGVAESVFGGLTRYSGAEAIVGGNWAEDYQKDRETRLAENKKSLEELNKALNIATTGLKEFGSTAGKTAPPTVTGPARDKNIVTRN